eukprot:jgi/Mesen1/20/ME1061531C03904
MTVLASSPVRLHVQPQHHRLRCHLPMTTPASQTSAAPAASPSQVTRRCWGASFSSRTRRATTRGGWPRTRIPLSCRTTRGLPAAPACPGARPSSSA